MFLRTAFRLPLEAITTHSQYALKAFSTTALVAAKPFPPRPTINEADIEESFLKGSGPGGQKINKTSSAVQLKHLPTGMVVKSQATRSQSQNRKIARQILADKLEALEKGSESRTALKAEVKRRKKASKTKKARRKYRALGEGAEAAAAKEEDDDGEEEMKGVNAGEVAGGEDKEESGGYRRM